VFGGAGNIIFNIPPEYKIGRIWNDIDKRLYYTMCVLQNDELREKLIQRLDFTFTSRDVYNDATNILNEYSPDNLEPIDVAYYFIVITCMGFNAMSNSFAVINDQHKLGDPRNIWSYSEFIKHWDDNRKRVIVENLDYKDLFKKYDNPTTLFYLDPPYLKGGRNNYNHDFNIDDFKNLKSSLDRLKGMWIMNESYIDFKKLIPIFGEPNEVIKYVNFVSAGSRGTKSHRLEGYWGNVYKR
jgi:DNA adenine methylase